MRIIAGKSKGRPLIGVKGKGTRPTSDRVKEAIFNIIQNQIEGSIILDLFAGTGSLGLEALSRGAKKALFIDSDARAIKAVKTNCATLGYIDETQIYRRDAVAALTELSKSGTLFDIIFVDPPYEKGYGKVILESIAKANPLKRDGIIIVEHDSSSPLPKVCHNLVLFDNRKYGGTGISFYRKE